jgi:low affinity Fe/Cu permease
MEELKKKITEKFEKFSNAVTRFTGSSTSFIVAFAVVLIWALTGPLFNYSETWQLVINTGTTIITFLMVFLIQKSQNKESMAVQLKLNELLAANKNTSNRMVSIEDLSESELNTLRDFYCQLAELAKKHDDIGKSHSIDEAEDNHEEKQQIRKEEEEKDKAQKAKKGELVPPSKPKLAPKPEKRIPQVNS